MKKANTVQNMGEMLPATFSFTRREWRTIVACLVYCEGAAMSPLKTEEVRKTAMNLALRIAEGTGN